MPLLNEGTDVSRPVIGIDMGENIFQIKGSETGLTPGELDEEWLYPIGSYVKCKAIEDEKGKYLKIIELYKAPD